MQSKSLNDLQELDVEETRSLLSNTVADKLTRRWSFTNLLSVSDNDAENPMSSSERNMPTRVLKPTTANAQHQPETMLQQFQMRLAKQVYRALTESINDPRALEELFYNISSTVPSKFAEKLNLDMERRWFYYELLATYYYMLERKYEPGKVEKELLPLCAKLWSLEHFPSVFSLLLHRWVVETDAGLTTKGWVMRFNVLLKGTYQLFWFDIEHDTRKLWPLYVRLREKMFEPASPFFLDTLQPDDHNAKSKELASFYVSAHAAKDSIRKDFAYVLARFYFYYSSRPERVQAFCINQLQLDEGLDSFVPQLVQQLRTVGPRNEKVLLHYLRCTSLLPIAELNLSSRNKLYATLNELQMLGPPLHVSRTVAAEAKRTMDQLFPQGRYVRVFINLLFALLRPFHIFAFLFASEKNSTA